MRIASGLLCVLLILFMAVQYNDPDGLYWAAIYAVPALFCGLRAFKPQVLTGTLGYGLLTLALLFFAVGVFWFWPQTPGFWRQSVWWVTEEAREGMGMMIGFIALLVVWLGTKRVAQTV